MTERRIPRYGIAMLAVVVVLVSAQGCYRSQPMSPADGNGSAGTPEHLPFHPDSARSDIPGSPASKSTDQVPSDPKSATSVPFRTGAKPQVLPAGTLLTVQLDHALSAVSVHAGDEFAASVAAPLVNGGNTVVERGAEVTGRVEDAQSRHGSGYVELTLSGLRVDGTLFEVQTSSLFAHGTTRHLNASSNSNPPNHVLGGVRIPKGRRLTFRLTAPVTLGESIPQQNQASKISTP